MSEYDLDEKTMVKIISFHFCDWLIHFELKEETLKHMHKHVETLTKFPSIFMKRFDYEYLLLCND